MKEDFTIEEIKFISKVIFITCFLMIPIYYLFKEINILNFWSGYVFCLIAIIIYGNVKEILEWYEKR